MKAGILGGGQLGRMLLQAAANYPVETYVLESDRFCPSAHLCHHFVVGDIRNYSDVYHFGKELDVITIEIESVNVEALERLEEEGVKVIPSSVAIKTIKNKIFQKQFYKQHNVSSPDFIVTQRAAELSEYLSFLPAVHKIATGGYDGKGVQIIRSMQDVSSAFNEPSVLEKMVEIDKEIAVMVARTQEGNMVAYPPVEMVFDPVLNLLDFQVTPARVSIQIVAQAEKLAVDVVKCLGSAGVFAIEMFVDKQGKLWVNETAPRVHNSGHHTIEASFCSQFDMLWRILLGYPAGNPAAILPSAMINVIGAPGHQGRVVYEGLNKVLGTKNTFVHLYGKAETKPGRKMGHVTILGNQVNELAAEAARVKGLLRVISK